MFGRNSSRTRTSASRVLAALASMDRIRLGCATRLDLMKLAGLQETEYSRIECMSKTMEAYSRLVRASYSSKATMTRGIRWFGRNVRGSSSTTDKSVGNGKPCRRYEISSPEPAGLPAWLVFCRRNLRLARAVFWPRPRHYGDARVRNVAPWAGQNPTERDFLDSIARAEDYVPDVWARQMMDAMRETVDKDVMSILKRSAWDDAF